MSRTILHAALTGRLGERECTSANAPGRCENRFVSLDYPGAAVTRVFGINSQGDVAGHYVDSAGIVHAFVLSRSHQH